MDELLVSYGEFFFCGKLPIAINAFYAGMSWGKSSAEMRIFMKNTAVTFKQAKEKGEKLTAQTQIAV